jgi:DNA-binding response OmpR family regulator
MNTETSPHILAINHSPDLLNLMRELLEEEGFRVTTQSHLDKDLDDVVHFSPDLVILDYMWRNDDLNWSLLQMLRIDRRTKHIPVILCTGAVREVKELRSHLDTMDITVVLKPFDIDHLLSVIRQTLARTAGANGRVTSSFE